MTNPIKPEHYKNNGKETRYIIEDISTLLGDQVDLFEGFCIGNIIKYLTRYPKKGRIEDLEKAKKYIDFMIEHCTWSALNDKTRKKKTKPE